VPCRTPRGCPLHLADGVYIFNFAGLCVTPVGSNFAPKGCDYLQSGIQKARINRLEAGVYEIKALASVFGIEVCMSSGATSAAVQAGACGTPNSRLRIFDVTGEGNFKIRFEATGNFLDGIGLNTLLPAYFQRPGNTTPDQRFEIRTPADAARRLRVISYNIMLLSNTAFFAMRQEDRAIWIVQQIMLEDPAADVIAIQEAFDEGNLALLFLNSGFDRLVKEMEKAGYIYRTQRPFGVQFENGGVVIFSRWPVEVRDNNVFDPGRCTGADCLSAKGINYAKVNKLDRRYHFFNTHLQAGSENFDIRRQQLQEFRPWINGMIGGATTEPVILTGDFNVDMEHQPDDYREMLSLLGARFVNAPRTPGTPNGPVQIRYSVDPSINEITRERGGSAEWLDYILTAIPGPDPIQASYAVKQYKRSQEYRIDTYSGPAYDTTDLSDHGALLGTFVFPYGPATPPQVSTVPITFDIRSSFASPGTPAGFVRINGERLSLPITVRLETTLTHRIEIEEVPAANGERWTFQNWGNTSGRGFDLINPTRAELYRASFAREFELTVAANPPAGGATSGSGWYAEGAAANYSATPNSGFRFVGFSGNLETSATTNPGRVTMRSAKSITANFASTQVNTRFEARSTSGTPTVMVRVDGVTYPLPVNLSLDPTRTYRIEIVDVTPTRGERWLFQRWGHTASAAWDLVRPNAEATYYAEFQRQYLLTVSSSPVAGGLVSGGGWHNAGSNASITATANAGYAFAGYTGDFTGTASAALVPMIAPRNVTAQFKVSGLPSLIAQAGLRTGTGTSRSFPIHLTNVGQFAAQNARVTSITTTVIEGSGSLTALHSMPLSYGVIATGNATVSRTATFDWPSTAIRVRFTIRFEAEGGYTGTANINLYRN
jgi:endonuclease/exonuclease/phosphatase family metal-dependent hydrolase